MRKTLSKRLGTGLIAFALVLSQVLLPVQSVYARGGGGNNNNSNNNNNNQNTPPTPPPQEEKVTICHRTASRTNPYVQIEVSKSAVDGEAGNSGQTPDHYGEHQGPVFDASLAKGVEWGDIIPPVSPYHSGWNWSTEGQAIYNNDCEVPASMTVTPGVCVEEGEKTGTLIIDVAGTSGGTKVYVNGDKVADVNNDDDVPVEVTGLAAGSYTVELKKGNTVLVSQVVVIETCYHEKEIEVPVTPDVYDKCGYDNAKWIVPENGDGVTWSLLQNGDLVAYADKGYVFTDGTYEHNYGKAVDSNEPCPVTPKDPYVKDICGDRFGDYVFIPYQKGVVYKINGEYAKPGKHYISETEVTVKAVAKKGYEFPSEAVSEWTITFNNENCISIVKEAMPVTDTSGDGVIATGDVITWKITVTNNSDDDCDNFYVEVSDELAVINDANYIEHLGAGKSYTFMAYSTIGATEIAVCKAVNTATFEAKLSKHEFEIPSFASVSRQIAVDTLEQEQPYTETGSAYAEVRFECPPTGGSGGVTPDPEVPAKTVSEVVQELPHTGPGGTITTIIALLAAMVTYGAVYFAQPKRQLED